MNKIILASSSPRRKQLLEQTGISFEIHASSINEDELDLTGSPSDIAENIALMKAEDICGRYKNGIIIGADTVVVFKDKIYGKPQNAHEAYNMLFSLNGCLHHVITGVAVIDVKNKKKVVQHEKTLVEFNNLNKDEILSYIKTGEYEGKAGAYAIQGRGALLVKRIEGCYFNVVGLPLTKLNGILKIFGYSLFTN